jgi:methionyl-tRNA formyltransferase
MQEEDVSAEFRIVIVTQDDPFYVRSFFGEFFRMYPDLREIRGVVVQKPMGKRSARALAGQMFGFYGAIDFLRMGARYAKVKLLRRIAALNHHSEWLDLSGLCGSFGVRAMTRDNLHQPEFLDLLRGFDLDLIVSVAAPSIFKPALIDVPRLGCINIHHAPLPRYRGMMPNFWQLYHGEKTVGITIHRINPKIDEGEILLQRMVPVEPGESLDALIRRTKRLGARYMVEAIELVKTGRVEWKENRPEDGSYFSFPTKEDVRRFRAMGHRLL